MTDSLTTKHALQPGEIERYGFNVTNLENGETVDVGTITITVESPTSTSVFPTALSMAGVSTVLVQPQDANGKQVGAGQLIGVAPSYDQLLVLLLNSGVPTDITGASLQAGSESFTTTSMSAEFKAPVTIDGNPSDGRDMKITFRFATNTGRIREKEFLVPIRSV